MTKASLVFVAFVVFGSGSAIDGALIDFDAIDATGGPVGGVTLDTYLATFGVSITNGTASVADENNSNLVDTPSDSNYLRGDVTGGSFDFVFQTELSEFSFTRTTLTPVTTHTFPAFTVTAFDSMGGALGSVSDSRIVFSSIVPAETYTISASGIARVRITTNYINETIGSVLIDNVSTTAAVPEPSTFALMGLGISGYLLRCRRKKKQAA